MLQNLQVLFGGHNNRRHTPTLIQMEAVECGAAALGIILGYYGRIVPLAELRQVCGISRDGSKATNILKAAKNYGLVGKGLKVKELNALRQLECPYIVFWNFNHFLVVEGFSKEQIYLNDPASGPRTVSVREFDEAYTGVVLVFQPGPDFTKGGSKPSVIQALWKRLQGSTGVLIYCIVAGFLLVLPGLAIPVFTQVFVDNILIQNRQDWLRPLLLGMLLTGGLNALLTMLQLQFLRRMKVKLSVGMSSQFVWHILRLPVSFYAQRFAGEISSRIRLNDDLADILSGRLTTSAIAAVMVIFYALIMLQYDAVLTAIGIFFAIVNLLTLQLVSRRRTDANMRLMQEQGKVTGVSISGLQSMETLKASGLESDFFSRWSGYYAKAVNAQQTMEESNQFLGTVPNFLSDITTMLVLVIGGIRVMNGDITIGMLVAFQSLMSGFMEPINNLVNLGSELQEMEGSINRLDDVLCNPVDLKVDEAEGGQGGVGSRGAGEQGSRGDNKYSIPNIQSPIQNPKSKIQNPPLPRLQGYIQLQNVTFGYSRVAPPLIENFSLSVKPGKRVALVGGSGSGKSTIAKLICGLYEPWEGEILFDAQPRSRIPRHVLINSLSFIDQDILLFAGTVKDNLTLWDSTIREIQLVRACEHAAIHDVILSLPGGYNSQLLEGGANLSGGQRQRLEIARALVNNPSICVMDEATSALDTETEKIIDQKIRQRGCTCVIVAHRLSTIRDCDEIIVLERGKVVQRGTHQELQKAEGLYLELIRSEGDALEEG
ncbi:NHLP family bacteriocin export ABC transporter peptidase/permease/ATPase subunit [Scytonema hofmannii PCC 7110]|uniref:NHLP family bacteriocin export ABC transporter peptidase/permease/ATPase subunit n=1 Tax=Scytonema hofmannii PCC 7110 TaxID=128403 RepID=A0A139WSJ4_9CYAN|nr:NHLP family bacteriocin export ABC transporter peptidase/permease/ATPase subunit [Scytonema hofmannii]KYC35401.1 NHLP family bacteriocin export ABC transporter peptidase/permease/ATPase subunit [Scytonema hofmannii PCC 7110]